MSIYYSMGGRSALNQIVDDTSSPNELVLSQNFKIILTFICFLPLTDNTHGVWRIFLFCCQKSGVLPAWAEVFLFYCRFEAEIF